MTVRGASSIDSGIATDRIARAQAAFLGLAMGDALGAPVEFMTKREIEVTHGRLRNMVGGGWLGLAPGQVTDDTEMSLFLARSIVDTGGWSLPVAAEYLANWLKSRPRDVGNTVRRGLRAYIVKGQLETPPCDADAGNGAAMRLLPVALHCLGNWESTQRCILEQARLTHHHPRSDQACLLLANLVQLAVLGATKTRLLLETKKALEENPVFSYQPYPGRASGYVVDTIQTVLYFFFRSRDLETCLVDTINEGGDADTNGAIVGMLAGAYYGLESLPTRWLRALSPKVVAEARSLAERLVRGSPIGSTVGQ